MKPFASNTTADPNISLPQVDPIPGDEFLRCQRLRADAPVLMDGVAMKIVEHVEERGVLHLSQMNLK